MSMHKNSGAGPIKAGLAFDAVKEAAEETAGAPRWVASGREASQLTPAEALPLKFAGAGPIRLVGRKLGLPDASCLLDLIEALADKLDGPAKDRCTSELRYEKNRRGDGMFMTQRWLLADGTEEWRPIPRA